MNATCQFAASDENLSEPLAISAACFTAMALLCCVQMFFMIGLTFRRWSGLYFWSLIGATSAQTVITFSLILKNWILKDRLIGVPIAMSTVGYLFYPPLEFLVLYSRLHLLQTSSRALKFVLILTFLEWFLAELPMAISGVVFAVYPDSTKIAFANTFWWEFEEACYPAVDFVFCSLYFLQIKRMWGHSENNTKGILRHVAIMSTILILIDISYLILTNTMNWDWADALETFFFALKLQLEIYTLNMLTGLSNENLSQAQQRFGMETSQMTCDSNNDHWATPDHQESKGPHENVITDKKMSNDSDKRLRDGSVDFSYP